MVYQDKHAALTQYRPISLEKFTWTPPYICKIDQPDKQVSSESYMACSSTHQQLLDEKVSQTTGLNTISSREKTSCTSILISEIW